MNHTNMRARLIQVILTGLGLVSYGMALSAATPADPTASLNAAQTRVATALKAKIPIIPLHGDLDARQKAAQEIAMANPEFHKLLWEPQSKKPVRNEIMNVFPARPGDFRLPGTAIACANGGCYRVEMYNYVANLTTVGIVSLDSKSVLDVSLFPGTQPNIPASLKQVALDIAAASPEVAAALGVTPDTSKALMADTKTALNETRCERSKHLCVAPTFVKGDKALWAIVDLTDFRLIGVRWTHVGQPGPVPPVTERKYQIEEITERYCTTPLALDRDGWKLNYILTNSDGLRVSEVAFQGKPVLESAKLVDWHVSYSEPEGFGYSDAVGCPYFSTAAVIAIEPPRVEDLVEKGKTVGFRLSQNFFSEGWPQACNYKYRQTYDFYRDGRFRVTAANLGRGCGNNGIYRPVTRIAFANPAQTFAEWKNRQWVPWTKEGWQLQSPLTAYTVEGYQYRMTDGSGAGYYLLPNRGQWDARRRGDNAYVYVTRHLPEKDEGDSDLVTIGPCCNHDAQQGPEKYIGPTPDDLAGAPLVLWYVPQLHNDDTKGQEFCWSESFINDKGVYETRAWPCVSGPTFVPITTPAQEGARQ